MTERLATGISSIYSSRVSLFLESVDLDARVVIISSIYSSRVSLFLESVDLDTRVVIILVILHIRGGRRGWLTDWVRGWQLWVHFANFFPIKMVKTAELDSEKNYLLCSHPHGVLSAGAYSCFATEGTSFSRVLTAHTKHQ